MIEYEPDSSLRDNEQIPLTEPGGIDAFFAREVQPHAPDAWIDESKTQTGYEISFSRYFYQPTPLRNLEDIRADILALAKESEGLLRAIVGGVPAGIGDGVGAGPCACPESMQPASGQA